MEHRVREYIHYLISNTIHRSENDEENDDDPHTPTPFLVRPDHILRMTSQSIADDVAIVTRTREKWYVTR